MGEPQTRRMLDPLFSTDRMLDIFGDRGRLQGMLDFEAALARAEARTGVITSAAAQAIGSQCRAELFDLDTLARGARVAGNPAIPMVKELTALVARADPEAARFVHWGATSQDAMDTGLVLQLRQAIEAIEGGMTGLCAALAAIAGDHRGTTMAGRTWLQQALPITMGLKAAGWLSAMRRHQTRLREMRARVLVVQCGGAAGTLAALRDAGLAVTAALGEELALGVPDIPWHAHRDRMAEAATTLGLLVGSLGKMARDISLLMQTEVGEALEPQAPGRGGSSTMPHKRNPTSSAVALSAALRVPALVSVMLSSMVQEHERGLGGWQAEWETLPEICLLTAGALAQMIDVAAGLTVNAGRMRENLDATHGLLLAEAVTMALGAHLGRLEAHQLVEDACRRAVDGGHDLRDVLAEDARVTAHLAATDLDRLLAPANYTGVAGQLVDRVLQERSGDDG